VAKRRIDATDVEAIKPHQRPVRVTSISNCCGENANRGPGDR
jgi:hypothetical protein